MDLCSSTSSFSYAFTYDVFISFRGSDSRYGFTGNLYKALCDKGIHTFIDDGELQRGDEITLALVKAIQESRIAIIVFSMNYASSSFCLDELVTIIDCIKTKGRLVLPIFYNIDPSHVRHQIGTYGEALSKHEARFKNNKENLKVNMERLQKWKKALNKAANLSGCHYKHGDGYEYKFIREIVEEVSRKISRVPLPVADYPVGLESQVLILNSLLDVGFDDEVRMVGIHGIAGVGKTTLALAVYNSIADHFEALCFLENVRENSNRHGLQHVQSILLYETIGGKGIKLTSVKKGISIIQHRLQRKKVLLVLDDVDKEEQLQAIVGRPDWFGLGSRVIITTRDKQLLACHKIEKTYEVVELNKKDALELLRWKAFKSKQVDSSYLDVLNRVVTYASGLPLALEVIGSNLYKKSIEAWDSAINQYERIPNNIVLNILKISFDALEEEEKSVFLNIACFFKGYDLIKAKNILQAHHGYNLNYHLQVLVDKSLLKINRKCGNGEMTKLHLHDLIEKMGKEIVRQESPKEPGKRSRLWFHEDIVQVLKHNEGSNKIEIIFLQFPFSEKEEEEVVKWDGDAFNKMKSLKTLIIEDGCFSQGPIHLPNSLRVLEWNKYPSEDLPSDFRPNKLVICLLPNSCFSSLGLTSLLLKKEFVSVTNLNLDLCDYITQIPDISRLIHLETLSFKICENLSMIDSSVGLLSNLKLLDAWGCPKLRSFPPIMSTSLEKLNLSHCPNLENFPEIFGKMEKMTDFFLDETPIIKFPRSFQNLTGLQRLNMFSYRLSWDVTSFFIETIVTMPQVTEIFAIGMEGWVLPKDQDEGEEKVNSSNVQRIRLENCKLTDEFFLVVTKWFSNVKELILMFEKFIIIPECIKECHVLEKLELNRCLHLQEIRGFPPSLECFRATGCPSLTPSCRSMLLNQELHEAGNTKFILPLTPIPEWFKQHQTRGTSISFWFRNKLPELVLCVVLSSCVSGLQEYQPCRLLLLINDNKYLLEFHDLERDHTCLFDLKKVTLKYNLNEAFLQNKWNHAEVICVDMGEIPIPNLILQCGIHVLKQEGRMEDIQFTEPCKKRKLEDDLDSSEPQNHHQLLKRRRFLDTEVSATQIVQQQQHSGFWSRMWNKARSVFTFRQTPAMQPLDNNANEDSRSHV